MIPGKNEAFDLRNRKSTSVTAATTSGILPAGGAAGTILTKATSNDYDVVWAINTAVQKGDGLFVRIRNNTGTTLTKGQVVYTNGANGNRVTVALALATSDATSARTLGLISEDILVNDEGWVQIEGYLNGIDTQHLTEGAQVYLSPTTAGAFTQTKPVAPNHLVYVAVVAKSANANGGGSVLIKIQNGYELDELHDVLLTSVANGDLLQYESSTDLWKNKAQSTLTIAQSQVTGLISALAGKEPSITIGTTAQYFRGDKTFQTLDKTAVGLSNVDNTSDANKPVSTATQTALNLKANEANPVFTGTITTPITNALFLQTNTSGVITGLSGAPSTGYVPVTAAVSGGVGWYNLADKLNTTARGAVNGVASLDGSGLVPTNQLPALAITSTFVVSTQAAMLALTAQEGDVAVRTDVSKSFILVTSPASTLGNWQELLSPTGYVTSITAASPLTGGTITSTGTIGIDQSLLAIAQSQVSGLVTALADKASLTAQNIFTQVNSFNNAVNIGGGSTSTVGLEIGSTLNATTPFIDFHSNATANDFDARILASGGTTGTNGAGNLTYTSANHTFNGALLVNSAASFFSTLTANAGLSSFGTVLAWNNNALSLGVRNGTRAVADLAQYSRNDTTVLGGVTTNGLIYSGTTSAPVLGHQYTLTSAAFVSTSQATFTTSVVRATNPYAVNQKIIVSGVTGGTYNGSWIITGIGGVSGAWTATVTAPGTTTPFTNVAGTGGIGAIESGAFIRSISEGSTALTLQLAGASGTSTDFLRLYDGSNNLRTWITSAGDIVAPAISAIWALTTSAQDRNVTPLRVRFSVTNGQSFLQTWESSTTVLGGVNPAAQIFTGNTVPNRGSTAITIPAHTPTGTTDITLTLSAAHNIQVGQTVEIAGVTPSGYNGIWRAQNGTTGSTLVLNIGSNPGQITVAGLAYISPQISITPSSINSVGLLVRNATGQVANPIEIQGSNGAVLSRIGTNGYVYGQGLFTLGSEIGFESSLINALRRTADAPSPGISRGALYFRDGTASGTLRLATRTGASGVEETIVDNLSSTGTTAGAQFVGAGGVRTTGLINTNSSQYGNNILWSAPTSTTYYLLATLPTSNAGTYDHLRIDATYGGWTNGTISTSTFTFSNRDAFVWRHYLSGQGTIGNIKLRAYSLGNGSVEIWVSGEASQFLKFAYNISSAQQVVTVANPVPTTTVPTGTVVFDSSNVTTYPPAENQHGRLNILSTSDANIPFTVTGTAGQTGDLVQFFRGTTYSGAIERGGAFNIQPSQTNNGYALFVRGGAATGILTRSGGGNLQEWQNSSNAVVGTMGPEGNTQLPILGLGPSALSTLGGHLRIITAGTGAIGIAVRGISGQTANLLEVYNNSTSPINRILPNGSMLLGNTAIGDNNYISFINAGGGATGFAGLRWGNDAAGSNAFSLLGDTNTGNLTLAISVDKNFIVRGANGQSVDIQRWQTWDGTTATTRSSITSTGGMFTSAGLSLGGANSPINLPTGGNGTSGQVLTSSGSGTTPTWTTPTTLAHTHGNITNTGTLSTSVTATNPVKVVITDSGNVLGTLTTTGASATTFLRGDGTWVTPTDTNTTYTFATGTTNGTFNFTPLGGSATSVAIFGLNTAAYQPTTAFAAASHTHGNITNAGVVSTAVTATNPVKVIIADSGNAVGQLTTTGASNTTFLRGDGTWATPAGGGGSFTGGTLTSNLTLAAGTTTVSPLTFQSGTNLTTVASGAREYDGTVFYQTSNTNPGRALDTQNYYYVSSADWYPDFSISSSVQSMLGASTRGITVAAGTTYEYELQAAVQHDFVTNSGISVTFQMTNTTVSGSPTVSTIHTIDYGSNTTNFTTATTMSSIRTTGSVVFMPSISSGSRYGIIKVRGVLRVTGTGTTKIYPGMNPSGGMGDNGLGVLSGLIFKMTPIGNGTVTSVGAWA